MKHIPTRYFNHTFSMNERWEFIEKYANDKWEMAKMYDERKLITKSAVKIAEIIEKKLEIKLFPLITKIACKGFDISGGTYAFSMRGENGKEYYFDSKASSYKSLNRDYVLHGDLILVGFINTPKL